MKIQSNSKNCQTENIKQGKQKMGKRMKYMQEADTCMLNATI